MVQDIFAPSTTQLSQVQIKDIQHSYVVELKYVKSNASEAEIEVKTHDAEKQVCKYAETEMVRLGARSTHLHRIVIVYRGVEMVVCKEL